MAAGIDLHIHSTASDGTLLPKEIVDQACALGLAAIAITDHDTVAAYGELAHQTIPDTLDLITGVEISAGWPPGHDGKGSLHILGYYIDPQNAVLNQLLAFLAESRQKRVPRMITRLQELNIPIKSEAFTVPDRQSPPGRPHIAQWLVKNGYAQSIDAAFEKFLGNGAPAYINKERASCAKAIDAIKAAGGLAVLAHPGVLHLQPGPLFESLLQALVELGLEGIEVYYPDHTTAQTQYYSHLAGHLDLMMTGGTDFHGDLNPDLKMGVATGDFRVPCEVLTTLQQRFTRSPHAT